ncbi:bifunctional 4-hydroxy-2-oxoglutarate aldolase/2-dehydro-3-deoxy-phosphogluconate aldolase [Faecalicoccus sp. LCP19S3_E3]|uniref:bifunctional 4-hydroxy-2-oxoglutarate aldolase/2-dehydro-3-deoxy-phosphogluconate aldolase n=1 Tax=unclassified Faecalicoccus TaxID=2643311 RepID=UPI002600C6D4|nr:bifunctional 4-hydroxy-2-oxoglutarate aldolase/2-dehydro-3-deoxy-phosphogluconate aldolase [uncultured Faecalicoccus sp.]
MIQSIYNRVQEEGIVPVVEIEDVNQSVSLATALLKGGIHCVEITFRTKQAANAIKLIKERYPDLLVAAGTVLSIEQVDEAVKAGADFIVSPGFNETVVHYCMEHKINIIPGCSCPSDLEKAVSLRLSVVKFFPAEAAGGINAIKVMAAPYRTLSFMPTGGINLDNLNNYLSFDRVIACGGSWIASKDLLRHNAFDEIEKNAREAVHKMIGFELAHVGINAQDVQEARSIANFFEQIFGFTAKENPSSIFSDSYVETLKSPYLGKKGHIAIAVNSVERAKAYLINKGILFNEESTVIRDDGKIQAVYFKDQIGGFAIHLVRNSNLR